MSEFILKLSGGGSENKKRFWYNVGRATMITQKRLETFKIKYMTKNIQPENFVFGL